jgi:putative flavoprotein involved in K+ transport
VATGGFQVPRIPPVGSDLPARILQLHSHAYRNAGQLPDGTVVVVGSAQSGVQIAEELHEAGRSVILSVGHCGRMPRRYRCRDIFHWLADVRAHGGPFMVSLPTTADLGDPRLRFAGNAHMSGHRGGHDTNLRRMAVDGIRLVGHLDAVDGDRVHLAADLAANLRFADAWFDERLRRRVDTYIERAAIDAPTDDREPFDFDPPEPTELDLAAERVSAVIWATGYRLDFGWIDLPIFDAQGFPLQEHGVSTIPGLGFVGIPWMVDQGSATLFGVGSDAVGLVERLGPATTSA